MTKHIGNRVGVGIVTASSEGGMFNAFSQFFYNSPQQGKWKAGGLTATGGVIKIGRAHV